MAKLSLYNEFGDNNTLLAIEPASKCAAHCPYCFAELNRRHQWGMGKRNAEDPGTFESSIEKATGPNYDPTDIVQWAIVNRMPVCYANTVEPFQDAAQAAQILKACDSLSIPLVVQTKGINFDEVWPYIRAVADNMALFVSMGSDDDRAIRRFEPGTPFSAERWAIIDRAVNAGINVTLALSPYHEDICSDPVGLIRRAKDHGVESVFYDRLHLTAKQQEMSKDKILNGLGAKPWDSKAFDHYRMIYEETVNAGMHITNNAGDALQSGLYATRDTITDPSSFKRGGNWPYYSTSLYNELEYLFDDTEEEGPIVITWDVAIRWIERFGAVDQVFSRTSVSSLMSYNKLTDAWKKSIGEAAPVREYFRAFYNSGKRGQFLWNHPYIRMASRPDGAPWLDVDGNLVMVYAPFTHVGNGRKFTTEDLEEFRFFDFEEKEIEL